MYGSLKHPYLKIKALKEFQKIPKYNLQLLVQIKLVYFGRQVL